MGTAELSIFCFCFWAQPLEGSSELKRLFSRGTGDLLKELEEHRKLGECSHTHVHTLTHNLIT